MQTKGPVDDETQQVCVDGLVEKVVGSHGNRPGGVLAVIVAGNHDDLGVGRELERLGQCGEALLDAFGLRRQAEVLENHGGFVPSQLGNCLLSILGRVNVIALETPLELFQQPGIVFDDK